MTPNQMYCMNDASYLLKEIFGKRLSCRESHLYAEYVAKAGSRAETHWSVFTVKTREWHRSLSSKLNFKVTGARAGGWLME